MPKAVLTAAQVEVRAFSLDAGLDVEGPRAIEVATLLGPSPIDVRHLTPGRRGGRAGQALIAAGLGALVLAGVTFGRAVRVAGENARAFDRWVDLRGPTGFRARPLPRFAEVEALGGLVLGVALLTWGLVRRGRGPAQIRVGRTVAAELPLDHPTFALVHPREGGFALSWADGMTGVVCDGDEVRALADLRRPVPISPRTRARIEAGVATFLVSSVPMPAARLGRTWALDVRLVVGCVTSIALHAAVLLLAWLAVPPGRPSCTDEDGERYVVVRVNPPYRLGHGELPTVRQTICSGCHEADFPEWSLHVGLDRQPDFADPFCDSPTSFTRCNRDRRDHGSIPGPSVARFRTAVSLVAQVSVHTRGAAAWVIRAILERRRVSLARCHDRRDPTRALSFTFRVGWTGLVDDLRADSPDPMVEPCLRRALANIAFLRLDSAAEVRVWVGFE
jgi:hypothetical protein